MELLLIGAVALLASGLTLFSGFGLGTVLLPAFALFFPVPLAVAATAVVHFANNLFKFWLLARDADWRVVARFGIPAAIAALAGAALLVWFDRLPVLWSYEWGDSLHEVTAIKALIGALIVVFALLEFWPAFQRLALPPRWLPFGGALSGFFGGLSGNQGALRSAFLLRAGLSRDGFVATGVVSAVIVDAARLLVYGFVFVGVQWQQSATLVPAVLVATLCAFAGAFIGQRVLKKVTLRAVQYTVAVLMLLVGVGLLAGLV